MEQKLDKDQTKAVEHFEGPALVVAGPGSGKTTVIKERILNLVHKHNVDPANILAIAFTNAAADEMTHRLSNEPILNHRGLKICTLHVFGKDLITDHYKQARFKEVPNNVWDADDIGQIINKEKYWLLRTTDAARVAIYKFEGTITGRCYIGQTTDPERREWEHRTHSSNRGLRDALQIGDEKFEFNVIETVNGQNADEKESDQINFHINSAAVNLDQDMEQIQRENSNIPTTIYKIKSRTTVTCYIGQTTDPERSKELHFTHSPNDLLRKAIKNEDVDQFTYEIIDENVPRAEAPLRVAREIEKHRTWAVFNRQDPLQARESNRRRIEIFCEYFDVPYGEVIEHTQKFRDLIEKFNTMKDDIEIVKRQVDTGLFEPDKIADPVLRAFAKRYEQRKEEAKAIDFLDMLIRSANMLEENQHLLREYRNTYRYVFVDEFQDISPVDFRLITLFSENLFAVGDDDQAIYGFRGGDSQIMQERFGQREHVTHYEIARNYRSTSSVVKHTRSVILHNNPYRFSKNLRAENPAESRVGVTNSSPNTIKYALLSELLPIVTVCETHFKENTPDLDKLLLQELIVPQEIGILARNWYEVKKIQQILRGSELLTQGFKVSWSETDDEVKRKMFLQRGTKEIEVSTIHSAKGREWEKVILIVNAMANDRGKPYVSLPDSRNNLTEERRVFYVAITRAKQELVILGRNCQFISEFQNIRPIEVVETIESQLKDKLEEISKKALETFKSKLKQELKEGSLKTLQQSDELNFLRHKATETENAVRHMKIALHEQLNFAYNCFLKELIPVLDAFESQINNVTETVEADNLPTDLAELYQSLQHAQQQLLNSLDNHGGKPIDARGEIFNPDYHEEIQPAIYSDDVPAGRVLKEEKRGYLLHDRVIRKAQVTISKGENIRTPERLDRVVEIYLDRLISAFEAKYQLTYIDRPLVKQEMVKYLLELYDKSIQEIYSFASRNKTEAIQLKRYADYCAGPEKIHRCTNIFRGFWNHMWEVIITQNEDFKRANTFFSQDFAQPVRFITYTSTCDLKDIETFTDRVKGVNPQGEEVQLQKLNVLFAFPKDDMKTLKSHIYKKPTIVAQNLQPIKLIYERYHIANDTLKSLCIKRDTMEPNNQYSTVQFVVRSGHVLNGHLWDFDENFLYMNINKKNVIVYRAGIMDFKNLIWDAITNAYKNGAPINGYVTRRIKDGLEIKIGSLHGFLPKSRVELNTVQNLNSYVGKSLKIKIVKVNKGNNNFVLSRQAWLEEQRTEFLNTLQVGQKVTGVVKSIRNFGAFIELENIDGLLHKSEMAWKHINDPFEIVSVGEEIEVKVIKVDQKNEKISLSLKQMTSDPWENVEEKYPVGSTIRGVVLNIANYGVFVQLEEGIDGLAHVSQMPIDINRMSPSDIVSPGDEIEVTVREIVKHRRRISLSMRRPDQHDPFEVQQSEPLPDESPSTEETESAIPDDPTEPIDTKVMEEIGKEDPTEEEPPFTTEDESTTLCDLTNSPTIEHVEEVVDTRQRSEKFTGILNSQIRALIQETLETNVLREPLETVNDNPYLTPQKSKEILQTHIQNLNPTSPKKNADPPIINANIISDPPTESILSDSLEKTSNSSSNTEILHEEEPPTNEIQGKPKKP